VKINPAYIFLPIIVLIWITPCLAVNPPTNANDTLHVFSFNLYGNPDVDWQPRFTMILDEIESRLPDLIAFQEVVQTPAQGTGNDNRAKVLIDSLYYRTGTKYDFVFAKTHISWNIFEEGIAILTRHKILESEYMQLLTQPPSLFTRKVLWGRVLTPAGVVNFFNTHLSFGNQEPARIQQVDLINTIKNFQEIDAKVIEVAGNTRLLEMRIYKDKIGIGGIGKPGDKFAMALRYNNVEAQGQTDGDRIDWKNSMSNPLEKPEPWGNLEFQ